MFSRFANTNISIYPVRLIGLVGRVFVNGPGGQCSIPYQKLKKWYLIIPCLTLSNIRYVSWVKWSNPRKRVAPSPTPRWNSYWKGSLLVAFDYGRQLYLLSSIYTQLNGFKYCYQIIIIQFDINRLICRRYNGFQYCKWLRFYLTHWRDPNRYYRSGPITGACSVTVIVVVRGLGYPSLNPEQGC